MYIDVMKSKLHGVKVTGADLNYTGSVTIDEDMMDAAGLRENEKVDVLNRNNGHRLTTYVIKGERKSKTICLNGACARLAEIGDVVIIVAYGMISEEEYSAHTPKVYIPPELLESKTDDP